MDQLNTLQVTAAIRQLLIFAGGYFVAKGWIDSDTLAAVVPAVLTLGIASYGLYLRRANGVIASAASLPQVGAIVTTSPAAAQAVPIANVVGTLTEASQVPGVAS